MAILGGSDNHLVPLNAVRGTRPVSSKPPRMRTACTECHTSKVRCSGEKTGCVRCQQNNLSCMFKPSMVGRASKRRLARSHHPPCSRQQPKSPSVATSCSSSSNHGLSSPSSSVPGDTDTTIHALPVPEVSEAEAAAAAAAAACTHLLSPSSYHHHVSVDPSSSSSSSSSASSSSASTCIPDYDTIVQMDFPDQTFVWDWEMSVIKDDVAEPPQILSEEADAMVHVPPMHVVGMDDDGRRTTEKEQHPSTLYPSKTRKAALPDFLSLSPPGSNNNDNDNGPGCGKQRVAQLMSLCRMTHSLETHLRSRTGTLDEIMKVNKACLAEVVKLTTSAKRTEEHICRCSCILITTCLDTMLVLFEDVVRSSGLDPQEQLIIMRRILARELRNYRDVVHAVAVEFQDPASADFFRRMMGQWCVSLTNRLAQLPLSLDSG